MAAGATSIITTAFKQPTGLAVGAVAGFIIAKVMSMKSRRSNSPF